MIVALSGLFSYFFFFYKVSLYTALQFAKLKALFCFRTSLNITNKFIVIINEPGHSIPSISHVHQAMI